MEDLHKERMKEKFYILLLIVLAYPIILSAQSDRQLVREGNKFYRKGQYALAETAYRKALEKNSQNSQASYNLGCALMNQKNDSAAIAQFVGSASLQTDKAHRAMAYHNIGVIHQQKKNYGEAIEAYKQALRLNPNDNDTRYNLVLCKRQQKKQQQSQGGENSSKEKQQKRNDQNQDKNKQSKQNDRQQQQQQKDQMSRENAEQLLNAAMQQEKQTQERLSKAMQQPRRRKLDKNW